MLDGISLLRRSRSQRVSSYDRSGGNDDYITIAPGEKRVLAQLDGAGVIRHIWITMASMDPMMRRKALFACFWDGEENPSILVPIGDFFGQGWGEIYLFNSLPISASPRGGQGLNCYLPMPFGEGARVEIWNQSEHPISNFYYYIDLERPEVLSPREGRLHAWWNREITLPDLPQENEWGLLEPPAKHASTQGNYLLVDAVGEGHLVGVQLYIDNPSPVWYGEGDDMWLIDGQEWPGSLHGTGTEDFFNTAWSPDEVFCHPYYGIAKAPARGGWLGRAHCYRFLLEDPIFFSKSLHGSIEHGHANGLTLDMVSVSYWYQQEPHKPFPEILPPEKRLNMPSIDPAHMHLWRQAWRDAKGRGLLWGNER